MILSDKKGHATILISTIDAPEPTIVLAEFGPAKRVRWEGAYDFVVPGINGQQTTTDFDARFDVHYSPSDDGKVNYVSVRVLGAGEVAPPPSVVELRQSVNGQLTALRNAVIEGRVHSDDLAFAMRFLTNPVWMHKAYLESGRDVARAQKKMISNIWRHVGL